MENRKSFSRGLYDEFKSVFRIRITSLDRSVGTFEIENA